MEIRFNSLNLIFCDLSWFLVNKGKKFTSKKKGSLSFLLQNWNYSYWGVQTLRGNTVDPSLHASVASFPLWVSTVVLSKESTQSHVYSFLHEVKAKTPNPNTNKMLFFILLILSFDKYKYLFQFNNLYVTEITAILLCIDWSGFINY